MGKVVTSHVNISFTCLGMLMVGLSLLCMGAGVVGAFCCAGRGKLGVWGYRGTYIRKTIDWVLQDRRFLGHNSSVWHQSRDAFDAVLIVAFACCRRPVRNLLLKFTHHSMASCAGRSSRRQESAVKRALHDGVAHHAPNHPVHLHSPQNSSPQYPASQQPSSCSAVAPIMQQQCKYQIPPRQPRR